MKKVLFVMALLGFAGILSMCDTLPPPSAVEIEKEFPQRTAVRLVPRYSKPTTGNKGEPVSVQSSASPYSCHISTLLNDESLGNYWNAVFWVEYPSAAVEQANGKTAKSAFALGSKNAGPKAQDLGNLENIVRLAQCEMPDSKLAEQLLLNELKKFGMGSWIESSPHAQTSKQAAPAKSFIPSISSDWLHCEEWWIVLACTIVVENGEPILDCWINEVRCLNWVIVWDEPDYGTQGGYPPGWESVLPGEGCEPWELCYLGPNGGEYPVPQDPCTTANPPVYCSNPCQSIPQTFAPFLESKSGQMIMQNLAESSGFDSTNILDRNEEGGVDSAIWRAI